MTDNETVLNSVSHTDVNARIPGKGQLWTGRILHVIVVLFLIFDFVGKLVPFESTVTASAPVGITPEMLRWIGLSLLVCTGFYVIPRTSVLGAAFLTGYLGGAVGIMFHAHMPAFELSFPIIFAVLVWGNLWLRTPQLRTVFPLLTSRVSL
jgi:hypothetical protein